MQNSHLKLNLYFLTSPIDSFYTHLIPTHSKEFLTIIDITNCYSMMEIRLFLLLKQILGHQLPLSGHSMLFDIQENIMMEIIGREMTQIC